MGIRVLRNFFCCSRPYDKPVCELKTCQICSRLVEGKDCSIMCPIYQITCNLGNELYIGESSRSLHDLRFVTNPSNPSYKNEAFASHYGHHHPGQTPDLTFKLMKTERNTILRKVYEAMLIYEYKPSINDKEECQALERFLVRSCNYVE